MILLISPLKAYATRRLLEEARLMNAGIELVDADQLAKQNFKIDIAKFNALFIRSAFPYFNELKVLAQKLSLAKKYVVDNEFIASGFEVSKWHMYEQLKSADLPMPKTFKLFELGFDSNFKKFPLVLKWQYGFGGKFVHLVRTKDQFKKILAEYPKDQIIVQEYIEADFEYMVMIVGGKSLPKILKFQIKKPINGQPFNYDPYKFFVLNAEINKQVVEIAEKAAMATGKELCKVDILQKGNKFYILEVNRCPSLLPFEPYTKLNVAKIYLDYINSRI